MDDAGGAPLFVILLGLTVGQVGRTKLAAKQSEVPNS